jgi:micrococcal nuclease
MRLRVKISGFQLLVCAALFGAFAGLIAVLPPIPASQSAAISTKPSLTYQAKVIRVTDGDTIVVRARGETIKIRLAQIDAPESGQPWGSRSRQELAGLVEGKTITIKTTGQDRYGRTVAQIAVDGVDVNRDMIVRGAAWAYPDYVTDPSMIEAQRTAANQGTGLWAMAENQRVAPWEYRQKQRTKQGTATAR